MADRGFDVEDLLAPFGLKLYVPARKSGLQLTEAGLLKTQIARVRIHVERAINRAKLLLYFTMFSLGQLLVQSTRCGLCAAH